MLSVYNTSLFLRDCIESLLHQSNFILGDDYEIICVNDGSTDNSAEILQQIGSEYKISGGGYITVNQNNSGVSAARNNGLRYAKGDYVWFIDSDDYIQQNCCAPLIEKLYNEDLDFLKVEFNSVQEEYPIGDHEEIPTLCEKSQWDTPTTAAKIIIKREYLLNNHIEFAEDISYGEDTLWSFKIGLFKHRHKLLTNQFYNYRQHSGSVMHKMNSGKHLNSMWLMAMEYKMLLNSYDDEKFIIPRDTIQERLNWSIQNILFDALKLGKSYRKEYLKRVKTEGRYPYPILWNRLTLRHGLKNLIINMISLFFPNSVYYKTVGHFHDFVKRFSH